MNLLLPHGKHRTGILLLRMPLFGLLLTLGLSGLVLFLREITLLDLWLTLIFAVDLWAHFGWIPLLLAAVGAFLTLRERNAWLYIAYFVATALVGALYQQALTLRVDPDLIWTQLLPLYSILSIAALIVCPVAITNAIKAHQAESQAASPSTPPVPPE
ncbi:hypothetical protein [Schaalia sp. Marseille-Q2122]|uniref:hypothetical protein n=1 Tax=Schaalia sp. Marseille-Q2122 TaxID=2736604 RepID=UPI0015884A8C|nr:hypothetical protein [Schaalia sp. Marseille-Q2122]